MFVARQGLGRRCEEIELDAGLPSEGEVVNVSAELRGEGEELTRRDLILERISNGQQCFISDGRHDLDFHS